MSHPGIATARQDISASRARDARLQKLVDREFDTITQAGARHRNNYYAWMYARRLCSLILPSLCQDLRKQILESKVDTMHKWCCIHPGDISSWTFLLYLLWNLQDPKRGERIVTETFNLAVSMRWSGEAIWSFVREGIARPGYMEVESRKALHNRMKECCIGSSANGSMTFSVRTETIVKQTAAWIEKAWDA